MSVTYKYPRPALTVDCVVFGLDAGDLKLLLIRRRGAPFAGSWALPGGFVRVGESLEFAARRELAEETGLRDVLLEQLHTFGEPGRDPRGRVVSVAYFALVNLPDHQLHAGTDAAEAAWFPAATTPPLAFDHDAILAAACERLRRKARHQPIAVELLPPKFTLSRLQQVYEIIGDRRLDKRNFRRKILRMGILVALDQTERDVAHRAARLYRFDRRRYNAMARRGFNFRV